MSLRVTYRNVVPVKEFNRMQDESYKEYKEKCKTNGVPAEPQSRYFPRIDMKTGYVQLGRFPIWKKRKSDF